MRHLTQELRLALRTLSRSPGYVAVVVLTLALGIGGTTAMFSLVDAVLLKPLPYPHADRLALVFEFVPQYRERFPRIPVNAGHFRRWLADSSGFESMGLFTWDDETLTAPGEPRRVAVLQFDHGFLPTLGVRPQLGRGFTAEETEPGHNPVVIVSDRFWRDELDADPSVIGRSVTLGGRKSEVVGVLPRDFRLFDLTRISPFDGAAHDVQIFRPLVVEPEHLGPGEFNFMALGRMRPGVSPERAKTELDVVQAGIASGSPELGGADLEALVLPLADSVVGDSSRGLLLALSAMAAVLLIGCVNVIIVTLGRWEKRRVELAAKAALGAGRTALAGGALAETVCLAMIGGLLGLAGAQTAVAWIATGDVADLPRLAELKVDARVIGFTLALIALCIGVAGLLPAWRASGIQPSDALSHGSRGGVGVRGGRRFGEALAAGEIALCTVLLVVVGLLGQSLAAVLSQDRGLETVGSATAQLALPPERYQDSTPRNRALRSILAGVAEVPGVEAVGIVTTLPLTQERNVRPILTADATKVPMVERPMANFRWASPDYFQAMGIRLLSGRSFREEDNVERPVVVSSSVAARLWPGLDPLGRKLRQNDDEPNLTVVGVAADVPVESIERPSTMTVYRPYWERSRTRFALAVRARGDVANLTPAVLASVRRVEPEVAAFRLVPSDSLVADATRDRRFQVFVTGLFAAVALMLACIGVYGVLSQAIGRRTREIGLSMALGAESGQVARSVLLQGMRPVLLGLLLGLGGAVAASRWLESLLFGVSATDPLSLAAAPALLALAALIACFIPARRAASLDPLTALRHD